PLGRPHSMTFKAFPTGPEDGSPCCSIDWLDDSGTVIGHGKETRLSLAKPGVNKIRAIAHDVKGTPSGAEEGTVFGDNIPPTLTITSPLANGTFYRFVPYALRALLFDPNQDVSCNDIVWTGGSLPVGGVRGCEP